jgi:hypothetical protein|tara:strand:+ start:509 stop:832 length:324 start_codon:yes stop_codon:yes gene_type:complete
MCLATVRGFISLLVAAIFGEAPAEVLAVKPTLLTELGLVEALRMVRTRKTFGIRCAQASPSSCGNRLDRPESKTSTAVDRNKVLLSRAYRGPVWSSENQQNGWNIGM